jgi:hypothetical protein
VAENALLTIDLNAGTAYYFVVGSNDGVGGTLAISIEQTCFPLYRQINPVVSQGGPITVNVPGAPLGPSSGDLVFVWVCHRQAGYSTSPAGFTLLERTISGATRAELHVKTAGANEISLSNYTFTLPGGIGNFAAQGMAFSVKGGTVDDHSIRANASGSDGADAVTATNLYSWVFLLGARSVPTNTGISDTVPAFAGWATTDPGSLYEVENTQTFNEEGLRCGLAVGQLTPAGSTGDGSWTPSAGDETVGALLVVGVNSCGGSDILSSKIPQANSSECCASSELGAVEGGGNPPPGAGVEHPVLMSAAWTGRCEGGGVVPLLADLTDAESWSDS